MSRGYLAVDESVVFVKGFVRLSYDEIVLGVGGHIFHFVKDHAGLLVYLSVRRLNETVAVDFRERCEVGDKADVGAFGGLYGAHSAVMCVVNVTDFETRSVS